ncbi:MAG TPA: hypothetical protein VEU30_12055 [Thermoanaerobaculia bacterium]|nr:hypothetical protein [Thermoanaerobaculia bacterium]
MRVIRFLLLFALLGSFVDNGWGIDPNGSSATGDTGSCIDPMGGVCAGDGNQAGGEMDPNGGGAMDPNG